MGIAWPTKPERCEWSLDCQPGASSSRMGAVEAGLARAETQRFFWELAEAGVEGVDLRSPLMPQATGEGCGGGEGNWSPGPAKGGDLTVGMSRTAGRRRRWVRNKGGPQLSGDGGQAPSRLGLLGDPRGMQRTLP